MTTNLYLANCGIPLESSAISISNAASSTYPKENLFGGTKPDFFQVATGVSGDTLLTFTTAGQTANFIYLAKANLLQEASVNTITLKRHTANNYGAATTVTTLSSFTSATLYGPDLDDYITTFATTASSAYWFVNYNATATSKFSHSKLFLGNYFDPGKDPTGEVIATRTRPLGANRRAAYTLDLKWEGLTYAKTVEMYTKFYRPRRHNPVILFTTSYHDLLFDHRVLFGRITEMSMPPRVTDYCDVTMTWEEIV